MRLPWVQVEAVVFEQHAPVLARLLGTETPHALGLLCCMWRWVLTRGSDGPATGVINDSDAASLVEAGAGWTGKPGTFADSVVRLGLAEPYENGLRIKGLDRYAKAWIRQEQARARMRRNRMRSA